MTDPAPAVTGKPLRWLQLDGLVLLAAALILFAATHQPWWLVPAVILLPDLFMLGYLRGTRIGAAVYNLGHAYPLPAAMSLAGAVWHHPLTLALGLLWLAHIGMDRLARYGLKYDVSFQHTHLGGPRPSEPGDARLPGSCGLTVLQAVHDLLDPFGGDVVRPAGKPGRDAVDRIPDPAVRPVAGVARGRGRRLAVHVVAVRRIGELGVHRVAAHRGQLGRHRSADGVRRIVEVPPVVDPRGLARGQWFEQGTVEVGGEGPAVELADRRAERDQGRMVALGTARGLDQRRDREHRSLAVRDQHDPAVVVVQPPHPALQIGHGPFGVARRAQRVVGPRPERADVPQDPDRAPLGGVAPRRVQERRQRGQRQAGQGDADVADERRRLDVQLPHAYDHDQLSDDDEPQQPDGVVWRAG